MARKEGPTFAFPLFSANKVMKFLVGKYIFIPFLIPFSLRSFAVLFWIEEEELLPEWLL